MFMISVVCDGQMQLGSLEWQHKVIYTIQFKSFGLVIYFYFFLEINIFIQKICIKLIPVSDSNNF